MTDRVKPAIDDNNSRIGLRVRSLRTDLNLSLDALVQKSRVSRSMISLVERGESSPAAVVLDKVATGLGVPLATLFDHALEVPNSVSRKEDRVQWRDPQSGYLRSNISPANFPSPIQIVEITLPAGAKVAYETGDRERSIHQQIWVQAGRIELTIEGVTHRLSANDCLAMQLNKPTAFSKPTRKPARYIVIIVSAGPRGAKR